MILIIAKNQKYRELFAFIMTVVMKIRSFALSVILIATLVTAVFPLTSYGETTCRSVLTKVLLAAVGAAGYFFMTRNQLDIKSECTKELVSKNYISRYPELKAVMMEACVQGATKGIEKAGIYDVYADTYCKPIVSELIRKHRLISDDSESVLLDICQNSFYGATNYVREKK